MNAAPALLNARRERLGGQRRFLLLAAALWLGGRLAWPDAAPPGPDLALTRVAGVPAIGISRRDPQPPARPAARLLARLVAAAAPPASGWRSALPTAAPDMGPFLREARSALWPAPRPALLHPASPGSRLTAPSSTGLSASPAIMAPGAAVPPPLLANPAPPPRSAAGPDRWRGSAWMLWRGQGGGRDGTSGLAPGGTVGSQAGLRLAHHPGGGDALALYARLTAAPIQDANGSGTAVGEGALGVGWRPAPRVPAVLVAELRRRTGPATAVGAPWLALAGVTGGVSDQPVGGGLLLDAYGQAGVAVGLGRGSGRAQPFADGAASLTRPVLTVGDPDPAARVAIGALVAIEAAPGRHRVEVGPALSVTLPKAPMPMRATLSLRHPVSSAGPTADPSIASGPALVLSWGADF